MPDLSFNTATAYANLALRAPCVDSARLFHGYARNQWDAFLASLSPVAPSMPVLRMVGVTLMPAPDFAESVT